MSPRQPSRELLAPERVRLTAALQALPELDRVVLSLRLLDGLTPLEAAGALKLSALEVEKRTAAALRILAKDFDVSHTLRRAA